MFPAYFAIAVGIGMIGYWAVVLSTKQAPELESEPIRLGFHVAAEWATAALLLIAGGGLLTGQSWGGKVHLLAVGMLLYTAIVSPGYFAQKGQWRYVLPFGAVLILALVSVAVL